MAEKIFNTPPCGLLRWIGANVGKDRLTQRASVVTLAALGSVIAPKTAQIQVLAGSDGTRGDVPRLNRWEQATLKRVMTATVTALKASN